ncbi:mitotic checkpoint protein BUB3.2 isoform X4 [Physcomitrium patens]|uniref:mitotic checkpoint protein BUB3.2 isoform X4 n=1 Tax=Physcomitrium patens TaxID=3218 RepID=UPI003CCCD2D3
MMGGGAPPLFPPPSQQHQHYLDMDANAQPAQLVLGRELASPPADGISNLRFSNYSDHLLVSSWDAKVRLYDASANVLMGQFSHRAPVLDCCFHDDSSCFTASADHSVCRYDFNTGGEDTLGTHDAPVRCVEYSHATAYGSRFLVIEEVVGHVVTGSWDKTVRCWDPRGGTGVGTYPQPERVYSMSLVGHRLVVATAAPWKVVLLWSFSICPKQAKLKNMPLSVIENLRPGEIQFILLTLSHFIQSMARLQQVVAMAMSISGMAITRSGFTSTQGILPVLLHYLLAEMVGYLPLHPVIHLRHEPDAIFVRSVNESEVKPKPKAYTSAP